MPRRRPSRASGRPGGGLECRSERRLRPIQGPDGAAVGGPPQLRACNRQPGCRRSMRCGGAAFWRQPRGQEEGGRLQAGSGGQVSGRCAVRHADSARSSFRLFASGAQQHPPPSTDSLFLSCACTERAGRAGWGDGMAAAGQGGRGQLRGSAVTGEAGEAVRSAGYAQDSTRSAAAKQRSGQGGCQGGRPGDEQGA